MRNIESESSDPPVEKKSGGFVVPTSGGQLAENAAKLEADLASEKEERSEERFIWISVVFILVAADVYKLIDSVIVFTLLFLLSLILLIGLAQRLGVDWAVQGVGWLMHWISEKTKIGGSE